jgi:integrase
MPKQTKYPRLRRHVRKTSSGNVHVYFSYDMRQDGKPDVPLGKDYELAIAKWEEIHLKKPRIKGRIRQGVQAWLEKKVIASEYPNAGTRRNYIANIGRIDEVFGLMAWHEVELPMLRKYLTSRTNKKDKTKKAGFTANREMAAFQVMWNWARIEGFHKVPWPAHGMSRSKWKNKEEPRRYVVTNEVFDAIYAEAEPMLRDAMDLASATGMRLTDVRKIAMPPGDVLRLEANKTGKASDFDLSLSEVLPGLLERRRALKAPHVMLLSMPDKTPVTESKLRGAYDRARAAAAEKARNVSETFAADIEAMVLRDLRKMAANLAESLEEASKLLQHSSSNVTRMHYRTKAEKVRPVR